MDPIDRDIALDAVQRIKSLATLPENDAVVRMSAVEYVLLHLPSALPDRLSDDDFETIRIHLSAAKERLCNQHRWKEAEEYERLIERFMAFASTEPERKTGRWIPQDFNQSDGTKSTAVYYYPKCSICGCCANHTNFCPNCGAKMLGLHSITVHGG